MALVSIVLNRIMSNNGIVLIKIMLNNSIIYSKMPNNATVSKYDAHFSEQCYSKV